MKGTDNMNWYEKLKQYFPIEEMKSQEHMELLLEEKGDIYQKDEGKHHVLMYVEFETFIFVDYLYVSKEARGEGIGHQLINMLKEKEKPILLEVEPVETENQDQDAVKRLRFYDREGFKHASSIGYRRRSLATNEMNTLEILYWSPTHETEESIYHKMKHTYEQIHTYKDHEVYGKSYQDVAEVLTFQENESQME